MLRFTRISRAFWISAYIATIGLLLVAGSGCMSRAPSIRMLDTRAGYGEAPEDEEVALYQRGRHSQETVLKRSAPRVAKVYIFPHELPTRDYFWGGYVTLLITQDRWVFETPEEEAPPIAGIRPSKGKSSHRQKKVGQSQENAP